MKTLKDAVVNKDSHAVMSIVDGLLNDEGIDTTSVSDIDKLILGDVVVASGQRGLDTWKANRNQEQANKCKGCKAENAKIMFFSSSSISRLKADKIACTAREGADMIFTSYNMVDDERITETQREACRAVMNRFVYEGDDFRANKTYTEAQSTRWPGSNPVVHLVQYTETTGVMLVVFPDRVEAYAGGLKVAVAWSLTHAFSVDEVAALKEVLDYASAAQSEWPELKHRAMGFLEGIKFCHPRLALYLNDVRFPYSTTREEA